MTGRTARPQGVWVLLFSLLQACASPSERLFHEAADLGYRPVELHGGPFALSSFFKPGLGPSLHVYLEGDGIPWQTVSDISPEPTSRQPLALRLMQRDTAPALYLARPCYHGHSRDPGCYPELWTGRRYAPEIVGAMGDGLREFLEGHPASALLFIGHSGGGVLALLLAERFPQTCAVLTVGANIDIDAWTEHHAYSPLTGSLNPGSSPLHGFPERHYYGGKDQRTPPELFKAAIERQPRAQRTVLPSFDHLCCWERIWPQILADIPQNACPGPIPRQAELAGQSQERFRPSFHQGMAKSRHREVIQFPSLASGFRQSLPE